MPTFRKAILLPVLAIATACSTLSAPTNHPLSAYPHRYDSFDFTTAWNATQKPQGLALEGVIRNDRYANVDDMDLTVRLINSHGSRLAEAVAFLLPLPMRQDESRTFDMVLKGVAPSPGDLLRFQIRYRAVDDEKSSFPWLTTFTVDALTGKAVGLPERGGE